MSINNGMMFVMTWIAQTLEVINVAASCRALDHRSDDNLASHGHLRWHHRVVVFDMVHALLVEHLILMARVPWVKLLVRHVAHITRLGRLVMHRGELPRTGLLHHHLINR